MKVLSFFSLPSTPASFVSANSIMESAYLTQTRVGKPVGYTFTGNEAVRQSPKASPLFRVQEHGSHPHFHVPNL